MTSYPRAITFSMHPWPGVIDTAGRILDIGIRPGVSFEPVLVRVEPVTGVADTFRLPQYGGGQFELLNEAGLRLRSASIPFTGQLVWRPDPRGYVWSSITDRYRLVQQSLAGDTLRIIERSAQAARVTAEERHRELGNLADFIAAGGTVDPSQIPSIKPFLYDFVVDDRGYLWVLVPNDPQSWAFDVFDQNGRYLGVVSAPARLLLWPARPVFKGTRVYGFTVDELGIPSLIRLCIDPPEHEQ